MRLFAAVLPPPSAVTELAEATRPLHNLPTANALRWTERAGWHFTLVFMGEVPPELLPALHANLERTAQMHAPLKLSLAGGGHFGDRALWAGAAGERDALRALADAANAATRTAGVDLKQEQHPYLPHLTLARSRNGADTPLRPYADALAEFRGTEWTAAELSLVRSHLPTGRAQAVRPRYETIASWLLGADRQVQPQAG